MARKSKQHRLKIIHPHCAGIDIGSREHWVAVDPDKATDPIRCFSSFTDSLNDMADWLESLGVKIASRWKPQACTGFRCLSCLTNMDLRCSW
jgi:hypothetical protein